MSNDKMREEFDAWWLSETEKELGLVIPDDLEVNHDCPEVRISWHAWQASRAAVLIDLPQQSGVNLDWNQAIRYCHQAIEAAGIKVKP